MRLRAVIGSSTLLVVVVAGCGAASSPSSAGAPAASSGAPAASGSPSAEAAPSAEALDPNAPPKAECDTFVDLVTRTTALRGEIQTELPTAEKAEGWASRAAKLGDEAKAAKVTQEDLVIECAGLATRLGALTKDLRDLAQATKTKSAKAAEAHKRVLSSSEMVEVIVREPAARCAGQTKLLRPQAGKLSPEKIQVVISSQFPTLMTCYKEGQKRDPSLQGRVAVRFVIGTDGKCSSAAQATVVEEGSADIITPSSSSLPALKDKKVIECVVSTFKTLEFPKPDGGTVSVVYPVAFSATQ